MTAFTPGPWRWSNAYRNRNDELTWSLIGADGYGILSCDEGNSPQGLSDDANARLIAVAPELVDRLDLLCIWLNAALKCKSFAWDADQHEAATSSLLDARAALSRVKG